MKVNYLATARGQGEEIVIGKVPGDGIVFNVKNNPHTVSKSNWDRLGLERRGGFEIVDQPASFPDGEPEDITKPKKAKKRPPKKAKE